MTASFLSLARTGRHGLKAYLAAMALLAGSYMLLAILLQIILSASGLLPGPIRIPASHSLAYLPIFASFGGLLILCFAFVMRRIHQRPLLSTFTAAPRIRCWRIVKAAWLWLSLGLVTFFVRWSLDPSMATVVYNPAVWWPKAAMVLVASPLVALFTSVIWGYVMQAVSLRIRRPLVLIILYAAFQVVLLAVEDQSSLALNAVSAAIWAFILIQLVIRENGMELVCGYMTAGLLFSQLVVSVSPDRVSASTLFWVPERSPDLAMVLRTSLLGIVFYLLLFGRAGLPSIGELRRSWRPS